MEERKLGRGLDSLLKRRIAPLPQTEAPPENQSEVNAEGQKIQLDLITPNRHQPRREFETDALNELIESIRIHGVIQPIAVRALKEGFELISGERRWRACRELGLDAIPAIVHDATDQEMLELAIIENIQREDLDAIEKAKAYQQLIQEFGLTQEEAAKRLSQRRSTVANYIRLLDLAPKIQILVSSGQVSMGHARALLGIPGEHQQLRLAERIARGEMTVRQVESLAKDIRNSLQGQVKAAPKKGGNDPHLDAVAQRMRDALGTKVNIQSRGVKGRIQIDYYDTKSLNRILACLEAGADEQNTRYAEE